MIHALQLDRRSKGGNENFLDLPEQEEDIDEFDELEDEEVEEEEALDEELNFDRPHFRRDLGLDYDDDEDYE